MLSTRLSCPAVAFPEKYTNKKKYFIKENVLIHEYNMHVLVYHLHLVHVPQPYYYDYGTQRMVMERIHGGNVSDTCGECACDAPNHLRVKIQEIVRKLTAHHIQYVDITGYNFVIDAHDPDRIWIVDFEHAYEGEYVDPFVEKFCTTTIEDMVWNPDFK
jgi:tRNA A-37 threonylcarbamoyl transferase component Bud32